MSTLSLDGNQIGDKGLQTILDALKQKQLNNLYVCECGTTDTGAASLTGTLHTNNTLKIVSVCSNVLGDHGVIWGSQTK